MDKAVAEGPRSVLIDLGDHGPGTFGRGLHDVGRNAITTVSVFVRGADLNEGVVDDDAALAEEGGDFGQEDGRVVGPTLGHRLSHVAANEKGVVPESRTELGLCVRGNSERHDVNQFGIGHIIPLGQRFDQALGFASAGADEDPVAVAHGSHRLVRRAHLVRKLIDPANWSGVHDISTVSFAPECKEAFPQSLDVGRIAADDRARFGADAFDHSADEGARREILACA